MAGRGWNDCVYGSFDAYLRWRSFGLFDAESASITHDRFRPRITQVAKRLWGLCITDRYSGVVIVGWPHGLVRCSLPFVYYLGNRGVFHQEYKCSLLETHLC